MRAARVGRAARRGNFPSILLLACLGAFRLSPAAGDPGAEAAGSFLSPLARPPLDPPLAITGGFGEYRIGHFHAGIDLGTGERVGKSVFAPLAGHVERVRASGVGYGRSVYVRADDGRLIQLGHLDAFVEPLASYVAAVQESSGQYEQDLWPEAGRFRVRAGQRIAWSGQSGAGGPHLHFEIRRGDMALNPLRAGLALADTRPPSLASLTLEPLDDTSFVERGAAPYTLALGARAETLVVEGRVRAVVGARDGAWRGVDRMVPWSIAAEWNGRRTECRFDSISWATDMPEGDYVYDAGRIVGEKGIVLWAPAGFRPRVMVADAPPGEDAGTIVVRRGDAPRALRLVARDLGGGIARRDIVLRSPREGERGPDTTRAAGRAAPVPDERKFEFEALPRGFWRVTFRGAPASSRQVRFEFETAGRGARAGTARGPDWSAVVPAAEFGGRWWVSGSAGAGGSWRSAGPAVTGTDEARLERAMPGSFLWSLPAGARFEPGWIGETLAGSPTTAQAELAPVAVAGRLEPERLPLRVPLRLQLGWNGAARRGGIGCYRLAADGWEWVNAKLDSGGQSLVAESRRLGTFAVLADTLAPRITALRPASTVPAAPYNRWALEARLGEVGSGVDARGSYFEVDGARVPTEWDAEERTLRWRPRRPPKPGSHRFEVVATDRAGNLGRRAGTFVLD